MRLVNRRKVWLVRVALVDVALDGQIVVSRDLVFVLRSLEVMVCLNGLVVLR